MAVVSMDRVGDRIHVDWRCNSSDWMSYKDRVKSIIGSRFSKDKKVWTFPLDMETCRRFRDEFGDELAIGEDLWQWAAAQRAKEAVAMSLIDISKVDLTSVVDLPRVREVAPTMWNAMQDRPYQPVASLYMAQMKRCLNADQPGIGKTIETIAALVEQGITGPILVLAPKTSCLVVWEQEIRKWLDDDVRYTVTQTAGLDKRHRDIAHEVFGLNMHPEIGDPDAMHFLIANAEQAGIKKFTMCPAGTCDGDEDWCPNLDQHVNKSEARRPYLHAVEWSAIVADETHKWLINSRGNQASQVGYGFTRLKVKDDAPMYALSGTPLKGKPWNLFGTLNWLWPKTYTSKWRFIESFWVVEKELVDAGRNGIKEVRTIKDDFISPKTEASFFRNLKTVMIRRTKDELRSVNPAWMPPEKRYHDVVVPMDGSQRMHYRAMEKNAAVVIDGARLTATGVLAEMTRLKQFACSDGKIVEGNFQPTMPSGKFNWLLQFLEDRGIEAKDPRSSDPWGDLSADVRKVVVASQFTAIIKQWASTLQDKGIACYVLTGETKDSDRAAITERFQKADDVRVFLINTTAGGVSITLDAADDIVIADETWVPDEQEQVEDRVHRASNVEHQVDVWYLRTADSIEDQIVQANADKAINNHVVLDRERGLAFARAKFGARNIKED